ncbi:MAG TPA: hypothetical protein VJ725_14290 [Thermoanaerobaculia bacterium]|nr:hypothetical protein [Thermoanaerobaculia bacterium]
MSRNSLGRIVGVTLCLAVLWCARGEAQCVYPMTTQFGLNDNFAAAPTDPIPYNPALPQFVSYLNGLGIPTANMKTFDNLTSNRHFVATLRHGLRGCFPGATSLTLCFRARAHADVPSNDSVTLYDTDFGVYSFPVVYSSSIAPTLIGTWNSGTTATLCINLTSQMTSNLIGDMLQMRIQDDTAVDFITMTLN